jgi:putative transcriptional regulator
MKKLTRDIVSGLNDAIAHSKGEKKRGVETVFAVPDIDVKKVREKSGLTQDSFSTLFAIKIRTLQDWEQGRRKPTTPARILLAMIDRNPQVVKKTLETLGHPASKKIHIRKHKHS